MGIKDYIFFLILSVIVLIALTLTGFIIWANKDNPNFGMSKQEIWCRDNGGQYFHGNLFSNDNCIFPPKK